MTVETPEELSSDLLDLTATSLSEMRTLRDTVLDQAVRRTLDRFRSGGFGDSVQEQLTS
jgi:FXSXX-COOH protein